jgi:hypothetical protein
LEALAEVRPLSAQEIELKSQSNVQIVGLLRKEELKWYQRSKAQFILEEDSNTRYFHGVANGRRRKKHIHSLVQDEVKIEGHASNSSLILIITIKVYSVLLGKVLSPWMKSKRII